MCHQNPRPRWWPRSEERPGDERRAPEPRSGVPSIAEAAPGKPLLRGGAAVVTRLTQGPEITPHEGQIRKAFPAENVIHDGRDLAAGPGVGPASRPAGAQGFLEKHVPPELAPAGREKEPGILAPGELLWGLPLALTGRAAGAGAVGGAARPADQAGGVGHGCSGISTAGRGQ